MRYTSAEAAKRLRALNEEHDALILEMEQKATFMAAMGEEPDSVRPEFDFGAIWEKILTVEAKIRKVKHAINVFNASTIIDELEMTIDQVLIYIPQLTAQKYRLTEMAARLPKQRENVAFGRTVPIIDYTYANYDIEEAKKRLQVVSEQLSKAQLALDLANSTLTFEIED